MLPNGFQDKIIYACSILLSRLINRGKDPQEMDFKTILILRQDEIGDLCYSTPIFEMLRLRYPKAKISLWCRPFAVSLVQNDPNLDTVFSAKKDLEKNYDLIIDLRGGWKGMKYALLHPPKFRLERGIVRLKNKRKGQHPHEMQTSFEIIQSILKPETILPNPKIYCSTEDENQSINFIEKYQLKHFAIFHTGARRVLRMWPSERFAELAIHVKKQYGFDIVFIGDKNDVAAINSIRNLIPFTTFSAAGELSLSALASFTKNASLYVGNESGPLHIAALSNIPCLGLYGPGEPFVFYPYGKKSAVLHHILPCNPCNQIHCVHPENPCIGRITLEEVNEKIIALMKLEHN